MDLEAMIEAINSLTSLNEFKDKTSKQIHNLDETLNDLNAGKQSIKTMFSFKSKKDEIESLHIHKIELEKNLSDLNELVKVATYGIESQIDYFKVEKLVNYYQSIKTLAEILKNNSNKANDLWTSVSNDRNISKLMKKDN